MTIECFPEIFILAFVTKQLFFEQREVSIMGENKKDQTSDRRQKSGADRREISDKEKYIDYFVPEEEDNRKDEDRRKQDDNSAQILI